MNSEEEKESPLTLAMRHPPANIEAEQALLGALLTNNKAYDRVADFLLGEHFSNRINGHIYTVIARRIDKGQLADPNMLRQELEYSNILNEVGGFSYIARLVTSMISIINVADYGRAIYDCWIRRQLIEIGETIVNSAFDVAEGRTGEEQIELGEEALFKLTSKKGGEEDFVPFRTALTHAIQSAERAFHNVGHVTGLTSGLRDMDKKTGGLHPSDLIILAGRPGMGKTALATKIASSAARAIVRNAQERGEERPQGCVAVFSLEMSAEQLATRILSEQAEVSVERIRRGDIDQKDFDRFVRVSYELESLPLLIDDTPAITLSAMRARCRRLKRMRGLNFIVVDYLQLMRPAVGTRAESRVLEISMITQGLKNLAKEFDVPVLALSQLSRQVESREDKRPMLSDLRESGSIEQDADIVMFIYREEYYLQQRMPQETHFDTQEKYLTAMDDWQKKMEKVHNKAELILEKQRHGPIGKIDLFFDGTFTRFSDLDTYHEERF